MMTVFKWLYKFTSGYAESQEIDGCRRMSNPRQLYIRDTCVRLCDVREVAEDRRAFLAEGCEAGSRRTVNYFENTNSMKPI
jgi:hypothetical protein